MLLQAIARKLTHMPRVTIRGVDFHFERIGTGPPLLCVPGALGTGLTNFGPQLASWSADFSVIAPDPRGYGKSRPPERDYPSDFLERDADDMAALMAAIGFETFAVAGWSDGANSASILASKYPDKVLKLVIWAGNSFISEEDLAMIERFSQISRWSAEMRKTFESAYGDSLQELWSVCCRGFRRIYQEGGQICRDRLGMIRCQTLILHGALDPLVPRFHAEVFHRKITKSELRVFPEGGHNIHLAYADEFNELVRQFLLR